MGRGKELEDVYTVVFQGRVFGLPTEIGRGELAQFYLLKKE